MLTADEGSKLHELIALAKLDAQDSNAPTHWLDRLSEAVDDLVPDVDDGGDPGDEWANTHCVNCGGTFPKLSDHYMCDPCEEGNYPT